MQYKVADGSTPGDESRNKKEDVEVEIEKRVYEEILIEENGKKVGRQELRRVEGPDWQN